MKVDTFTEEERSVAKRAGKQNGATAQRFNPGAEGKAKGKKGQSPRRASLFAVRAVCVLCCCCVRKKKKVFFFSSAKKSVDIIEGPGTQSEMRAGHDQAQTKQTNE